MELPTSARIGTKQGERRTRIDRNPTGSPYMVTWIHDNGMSRFGCANLDIARNLAVVLDDPGVIMID